jgi:aryl-alcohol dehydrogenase-like predicted oxidoreductase
LLRAARAEGLVSNIGASIYDADDLSVIVERFPDLDLVQVPGNLVDRRLLDSAVLHRLHERGVEVHVRSAYLQGLLLSSTEAIPEQLAGLQPAIAALGAFAASVDRPVIEIALGYLKHHPVVDAVLVGALSAGELAATAAAWGSADEVTPDLDLPRIDPGLLDPRRWPPRGSA